MSNDKKNQEVSPEVDQVKSEVTEKHEEQAAGELEAHDLALQASDEAPTFLQKSTHPIVVALKYLASLKLTVGVFACSALLVWFGTLAQTKMGIWTVMEEYFRESFVVWIGFDIFEVLLPASMQGKLGGGFPFPAGLLLGGLLMMNLLAAHTITFRVKARGTQMWIGLGIVLVGVVGVTLSVFGFFQAEIAATEGAAFWRVAGRLLQGGITGTVLFVGCYFLFQKRAGIVLLHGGILLLLFSELITGFSAVENTMTLEEGETVNFLDRSRYAELAFIEQPEGSDKDKVTVVPQHMLENVGEVISNEQLPFDLKPIKWMKNTAFLDDLDEIKKRKGRVDDMIATLRVSAGAGETAPEVQQRLAALESMSQQLEARYEGVKNAGHAKGWPGPVNAGAGTTHVIFEKPEVTGVDTEQKRDAVGLIVDVIDKKTKQSIGVYFFTTWFYPNFTSRAIDIPQQIKAGDKTYTVYLRSQRSLLPYKIKLIDFNHELYPGTNRPKDFSSRVVLMPPGQSPREVKIWMNNPLRYDNKTFYQSSFLSEDSGTVLQVVINKGWMIPYLSCMIVGIGMSGVFGERLVRFLLRRAKS